MIRPKLPRTGILDRHLPYHDTRIIEKNSTLTGRLIGLLFADHGADVFVERVARATPGEHDAYLDRGKTAMPPGVLADTSSADVIIVDGDEPVDRATCRSRSVSPLPLGMMCTATWPHRAVKTC